MTSITLTKQDVEDIIRDLEVGLENTQNALIDHDSNYGRGNPTNKKIAEDMEEEISNIRASISNLKDKINQ